MEHWHVLSRYRVLRTSKPIPGWGSRGRSPVANHPTHHLHSLIRWTSIWVSFLQDGVVVFLRNVIIRRSLSPCPSASDTSGHSGAATLATAGSSWDEIISHPIVPDVPIAFQNGRRPDFARAIGSNRQYRSFTTPRLSRAFPFHN
jgi:hypothetical protein